MTRAGLSDGEEPAGPWLVTGAAGFIGFHTCRRLLEEGRVVIGVDVVNDFYDPGLKWTRIAELTRHERFAFHQVDVADEQAMRVVVAARRPGAVVHLAAQAGVRHSVDHPGAYIQANLVGFGVVLELCRRYDVEHLVYASSSSVYGSTGRLPFDVHDPADHPVSLYAATKRANEMMAHSYSHLYGLPTTGLRFFTVYGPSGRPDMAYFAFADAILGDRPVRLFGDGSAVRDFTYVDDVVTGVIGVTQRPARPDPAWSAQQPDPATSPAPWRLLNIGHGGRASMLELIELLEELIGKPAIIERLPPASPDVTTTRARTGELTALIGYTPDTCLRDGMTTFVEWLRSYRGV